MKAEKLIAILVAIILLVGLVIVASIYFKPTGLAVKKVIPIEGAEPAVYWTFNTDTPVKDMAATADFNDDDLDDVAIINDINGTEGYIVSNDGQLIDYQPLPVEGGSRIAAGDVDGMSMPEVVVGYGDPYWGGGGVYVYNPDMGEIADIDPLLCRATDVELGDLSGDDIPDIVMSDNCETTVFARSIADSFWWDRYYPAVDVDIADTEVFSVGVEMNGTAFGYDGSNGSINWGFPISGVTGEAADIDNDGANEYVTAGILEYYWFTAPSRDLSALKEPMPPNGTEGICWNEYADPCETVCDGNETCCWDNDPICAWEPGACYNEYSCEVACDGDQYCCETNEPICGWEPGWCYSDYAYCAALDEPSCIAAEPYCMWTGPVSPPQGPDQIMADCVPTGFCESELGGNEMLCMEHAPYCYWEPGYCYDNWSCFDYADGNETRCLEYDDKCYWEPGYCYTDWNCYDYCYNDPGCCDWYHDKCDWIPLFSVIAFGPEGNVEWFYELPYFGDFGIDLDIGDVDPDIPGLETAIISPGDTTLVLLDSEGNEIWYDTDIYFDPSYMLYLDTSWWTYPFELDIVRIADINGDGNGEIIFSTWYGILGVVDKDGNWLWYYDVYSGWGGAGYPTTPPQQGPQRTPTSYPVSDIETPDLNGDGIPDIVASAGNRVRAFMMGPGGQDFECTEFPDQVELPEVDVVMDIDSTGAGCVGAVKYDENPFPGTAFASEEVGPFFYLYADEVVEAGLDQAEIRAYYDPAELGGVSEKNLRLYYYNEDAGKWLRVDDTSVNTAENYVYGTVEQFSFFGMGAIEEAIRRRAGGRRSTIIEFPWTEDPQTFTMPRNSRVKYQFENVYHFVTLVGVEDSGVRLQIATLPYEITVALGETVPIDIDKDGKADFTITLDSTNAYEAVLTFGWVEITPTPAIVCGDGVCDASEREVCYEDCGCPEGKEYVNGMCRTPVGEAEAEPTLTEAPTVQKKAFFTSPVLVFLLGVAILAGVIVAYELLIYKKRRARKR